MKSHHETSHRTNFIGKQPTTPHRKKKVKPTASPSSRLLSLPDTAKLLSVVVQEEYQYSLRKRKSYVHQPIAKEGAENYSLKGSHIKRSKELNHKNQCLYDQLKNSMKNMNKESADARRNIEGPKMLDILKKELNGKSHQLEIAKRRIAELESIVKEKDENIEELHDEYELEIKNQLEDQRKRLNRHARAVKLAALREKDKHMKTHIETITKHVNQLAFKRKHDLKHTYSSIRMKGFSSSTIELLQTKLESMPPNVIEDKQINNIRVGIGDEKTGGGRNCGIAVENPSPSMVLQ